jgi:molybdenum-dependent DNA-binding transcriptional regulator ModE
MFDGVGHGLWKANPAVRDCTMIDWDDVRYFLAVARGGSVRAAAERLGVNHSTVLRRIAQLEERLGVQMFEKLPSGYRLTAAGEEILEFADQMEASSHQLETRVFGRDQGVRGLLRVTLAPPLATHLLMPDFADFARLHPDIEMEILSSGELVNLTNRGADVAIRVVYDRKTLPLNLHGLKGPELFGGVYMSRDRLVLLSQKAAVSGIFESIMEANPTEARGQGWVSTERKRLNYVLTAMSMSL